jgi:hypothetical protein
MKTGVSLQWGTAVKTQVEGNGAVMETSNDRKPGRKPDKRFGRIESVK